MDGNVSSNNTNKVLIGVGIAVGVILFCLLCFFVSVSASDKNNDLYSESSSATDSSSDTSTGNSITDIATEEANAISEDEMKDFEDIDVDEYLDMYDGDEDSIVLLSRPTCGYCQIAEPILHNIAYEYDLTIYHIDTDEMDADEQSDLMNSDDFFSEGYGTPLLLIVSDGEIKDMVNGLVTTDDFVSFFKDNGFID